MIVLVITCVDGRGFAHPGGHGSRFRRGHARHAGGLCICNVLIITL
jgi:hypothetical protein